MIKTLYRTFQAIRIEIFRRSVRFKVANARRSNKKIFFLLGVPEHNNIGDLAIAKAEEEFIKHYIHNSYTVAVPFIVLDHGLGFLRETVEKEDVIAGHGGGNMGDTYLYEEELRRCIINAFPDNKIVIFPQTIYFSNTKSGNKELEKTQVIYSAHKNLTLFAREKISYDTMITSFPNNTIVLTPDIVLSLRELPSRFKRKGTLTCIRSDLESTLNFSQKINITNALKRRFGSVKQTDTTEPTWIYRFELSSYIVSKKLCQFKKSKLVVTDRLHGMVLAAITGTPCIALTNFNHKVKGTYDWIKDLDYIYYINDISELEDKLDLLDTQRTYVYDPDVFDQYWQKIAAAID